MPAIEPLCYSIGINPNKFSKAENLLLEAVLFSQLCEELKQTFKKEHKEYFRVMKFNKEMENIMLEAEFARYLIKDILSTDEYSLSGIACYTRSPQDIIYEIVVGKNNNPSSSLLRKIIELHRMVRPELYREIIKKILNNP